MISYVLAIHLLLIVFFCTALPDRIKKCRFGDEKCMVKSINDIIKKYPKGIPELGIKPIDVVDIKDTELLKSNRTGFLWASVSLSNQINYGFENTTITSVKGFEKNPKASQIIISGRIPSLVHKGSFVANGHLWLVEMNLTGDSISEFQNMRFTLKLKVSLDFRNNKRYLNIYQLTPIVKIDRWILEMDSLFTENTDLTIILNRLFNQRWIEVWNEWEPSILDTFASVFIGMIKGIFNEIPYDDLFLPDDI
ncbi:protein takeout-like [Drosophila novamexicana]|uniref:protein takeout-like n=1 Tax=Drosophila novamexicana TaxID=47314 RepID=UPI0011E5CCF5|nr:protein takeout-like [Drosophila novamexicana]